MTGREARERAAAAVDELSGELIGLARALVRIPTETHPPRGDEGPGQAFLADHLRTLGWDVDVFRPTDVDGIESHPGWWPGLVYEDRPNVVARRRGTGGGRSLILNGHMDVVPAGRRERWSHDPYAAELADGRLYGRGAADMKGGIAALVCALRAVEHGGIPLAGDVVIESVVNEELGGYNGTLACCVRGYAADAAIVAEGTRCCIMPAHKGGQPLRLRVPGAPVHSNLWWSGVSALDKALLLKQALTEFERERTAETRENPYFADRERFPIPALVDTVWSLSAGDADVMATPGEAVLDFWCDVLPGEALEQVVARLERRLADVSAQDPFLAAHPPAVERARMRAFHPTAIGLEHPIVLTLAGALRAIGDGEPEVAGAPFACDAMIFNLHSRTPAVIFGPGDVAVAHAPDEYIELDELVRGTQALAAAIVDWCGVS